MSKNGWETKSPAYVERFAKAYNDIDSYPQLIDVAAALGLSYQSVRNRASEIRRQFKDSVCPLISRAIQPSAEPEKTPQEHARLRAQQLGEDVRALIQSSNYPVVNPEAVLVESFVSERYDRIAGRRVDVEGSPRTWITDTLRVQGVEDPRGRTFLFTGAQNDAPVHENFWRNLQAYAAELDADIVVGPWTYETQWWDENNPTSRTYDKRIAPYLCFGQMEVGENFVFCGEMNTLPTASRPISDLTTYSRNRWAVFPHAKIQLQSVPSDDPSIQAHQVMTTGAVTRPKVIPRKAGVKSIFHHIIGATIVEFDEDGDVFCRQINAAEDGSFYDLDCFVSAGQITHGNAVRAMTAPDVHAAKLSAVNSRAVFGYDPRTKFNSPGSLLEALRPENLLIHDLHDHESRNHHHEDDVSHDFEMAIRNRASVIDEVQRAVDFIIGLDAPGTKITVIESNHDLALERYIREGRYRNDGINFRTGLELDAAYHDYRAELAYALDNDLPVPSFSMLEWTMRRMAGASLDHVAWVHDGKPLVIDEVNVGSHGFRGSNGARGTIAGYARLGRKMSIGDKHSPAILDGVYCAGVMQLQHGYNKGPSGWAVATVIQYANGKRALVTLQNGKWRAQRSAPALKMAA